VARVPEGDTIFRTARTLNEALAGRIVTRFETVLPKLLRQPVSGRTVERVSAAGKHLIIDFSGGLHLRTHMRMNGSWHIYRPGERWQRRRSDMRIVIGTEDWVAVGFNIPVAELAQDRVSVEIGPDLLGDFDEAEALRRIRARGSEEIANVLLNQRVLAGIGNIYKSESLFAARVNPFMNVQSLSEQQLAAIVTAARKLMRAAALHDRTDRAVYSRAGKPCRRCGTPIASRRQGPDARWSYWCPECQR
jgi:endonuclease-8